MQVHLFVKEVIQLADRAKTARDYRTADLAFLGLISMFLEDCIPEGVFLEYEHRDGDHPYYDLLVIVVGEERLCMPRPMLATEVYRWFIPRAVLVERLEHGRCHEDYQDLSAELEVYQLTFPGRWLLPSDSDESLWLTKEETDEFRAAQSQSAALDDELYAIQDSLSD